MNQEKFLKLKELFSFVERTVSSDLSGEDQYGLVFNKSCSAAIMSLYEFEYYEPDTSYEDDVMAFYFAFKDEMEKLEKVAPFPD